jgi:hypothetical protein
VSHATLAPTHALAQSRASSDSASDNLAVVRMWWTVLEGEWRAALAERDGGVACAVIEPRVRDSLSGFDDFEASIDDLMAWGDRVVASLELRGRIGPHSAAMREAWVCRLHEGAVVEVRAYDSLEAAAAAVSAAA